MKFPFQCVPKTENYFCSLFPKIAALALKLPDYVKKVRNLLNPLTPQFTNTDDEGDKVCVHVFRPSRCFRGERLQPSLCRKFRYPACLLTHFSALSLTATPPIPVQSTTATPPLTSPGQETIPQCYIFDCNP